MKTLLVLVAFASTIVGLPLIATQQWKEAAIAWCLATVCLWIEGLFKK